MKAQRGPTFLLRLTGELVVIVLGILIALWVNNWNEERKDAAHEGEYLEGFLTDLTADSANLAFRVFIADRGVEAADRLLELKAAGGSTAPSDTLAHWFFHAAFVDNFQVLDHTYREILSGGGLALIRNDDLRRQITEYYRKMESAEFFNRYWVQEEIDYFDYLEARLPFAAYTAIMRVQEDASPPPFDAVRTLTILRDDDRLANSLLSNRHWAVLRRDIAHRRGQRNATLRAAVSAELEQR